MRRSRHASSLEALGARAEAWVRSWPGFAPAADFPRFQALTERASGRRLSTAAQASPYWTLLPRALAVRKGGRPASSRFVEDVLWAQFCLFLFVRMQDDVFDGQAADRRLIYAADQFLVEAERTFGRHFARRSRFWGIFHGALETSTRAILRVDEMQRDPGGRPGDLLEAYAEVAAIFKVGTAGVCLETGRPRDIVGLSRFADEMAIAGQILDDLEDVEEDLRRPRFNYVAKRLLGARPAGPAEALARLAREIVLGDGALRVLSEAEVHVERASAALAEADCAAARAQAAWSLRSLARLKAAFHRRSVEVVLGPLMRGPARSTTRSRRAGAQALPAASITRFRV